MIFPPVFGADLAKAENRQVWKKLIFSQSGTAWKFSYEIVHTDAITIRSIYFSQEEWDAAEIYNVQGKAGRNGQLILEVDYTTPLNSMLTRPRNVSRDLGAGCRTGGFRQRLRGGGRPDRLLTANGGGLALSIHPK